MLRKLLVVLGMLATATANAENWQLVEDGNSGVRLIVDVDTAQVRKYNKDDGKPGIAVTAKMSYVDSTAGSMQFATAIDGDECIYKGAGTIVNVYSDRSKNTYFWSIKGNTLYDAQGEWMCAFLIKFVNELDQNEKKQPNSKQSNKPKIKV